MENALPDPIPHSVAWLGYGGLLPFLFLAPASLVDPQHAKLWSDALLAYGAVILSFVGALFWGFAMILRDLSASRRTRCFVWSVVPTLLAWSAFLFSPVLASVLLVNGFLAHYGRRGCWSPRPICQPGTCRRLPGRFFPGKQRQCKPLLCVQARSERE